MTQYPDTEPEDGYYEIHLGFFWDEKRDKGPQTVTIDFQLTEEMEEDYPSEEEEKEFGFEGAEQMRADWVQHHLSELLDRGFVTDAYGNEFIHSVDDLEDQIEDMRFELYYA